MRFSIVLFAAVSAAVVSSSAHATTVNATVYSNTLAAPASTDSGPGHVVPVGAAGNAPGYGTGSFYASVVDSVPAAANRYSTFRVNLSGLLGGRDVLISDLKTFSYLTQTTGVNDWRISIYTQPTGPNANLGSFYQSRIQAQPAAANAAAGVWTQQTESNLTFFESNLNGGNQNATWTWKNIQDGSVTASPSNQSRDFRNEKVYFIDFTLGADNGGKTESGYLDGVNFGLSNGDSVRLDLEAGPAAVPLPGAAIAGVALLGRMGLTRRRRASAV